MYKTGSGTPKFPWAPQDLDLNDAPRALVFHLAKLAYTRKVC